MDHKPSEVLQMAIDQGIYTGVRSPGHCLDMPPQGFMCCAVAELRKRDAITRANMQRTHRAIRRAIRGRWALHAYLEGNLGLSREAARDPANKLAFYRGLIKRLRARGL